MAQENIETKVEKRLKPIIENLGYSLYDVLYEKEGKDYYLRIIIDKEGTIDIKDCETVNGAINDILDEEKRFQKKYGIESCALMEKFPITKEVVEFVNCEYNKLAERNGDKKLEIKFDDLQKKDRIKGE